MVNWSYIVTCNKCGYISSEKLPKEKAKKLLQTHLEEQKDCKKVDTKLMKVRS